MLTMFKPVDLKPIAFVKMYSSVWNGTREASFAYILMPYASQRDLVSLQSIHFVFNKEGEVLELEFIYSNHLEKRNIKVRETIDELVKLNLFYGKKEKNYRFDEEKNALHVELASGVGSQVYLLDIIRVITPLYRLTTSFAEEIQLQLLDKNYLQQEFIRLQGKEPKRDKDCILM